MSSDSNSTPADNRLVESGMWKGLRTGWWILNILFAIYLATSYSGIFRMAFPQLFIVLDSEVFFRAVAIVSILLTVLTLVFQRQIVSLLAAIKADYDQIVTCANPASDRFLEKRSWLDMLLRLTAFIAGGLLVYYALIDREYYLLLIREDNIVEMASSLLWFVAAIVTLVSLGVGYRQGSSKIFYLLLALFFFVCGGEEISWGQRLFEFETPELLRAINVQEETTLHNIGSISIFSNAFFLLSIAFFLVIPWLQRLPGFTVYLASFGLPSVQRGATVVYLVSLTAWIIVGIRYGTLGFHPFTLWDFYEQLDDELFEMMAAFSFFSFAALDLEGKLRAKLQIDPENHHN
jgi:hypothetical protein